ncbi:MAG: DUF1559 domain-containing protein [Planctomycetaceae bacterium]|mgnify:CR=1 FL=1|nr:DUF1559 domain-containing protein [Planctomycetaceae bacterium]
MRLACFSLPLIVLATTAAWAEDKASPRATEIAPVLDQFARAVVCIDLKQADVAPLFDLVASEEVMAAYSHIPLVDDLEKARSTLLDNGIDRVYFVVSLADMPHCPGYLVAPCTRTLQPDTLAKALPDLAAPLLVGDELVPRTLSRQATSWFYLGTEAAYQRLRADEVPTRPDLSAAIAASSESPVQVFLLPSDDDRRLLEELLPTLPEPLGSGPSSVLARGLHWAVAQLNLQPEPAVRLVIQSTDHQAARRFREVLVKAVALVSQQESHSDLPDTTTDPAHVSKLIPQVQGDRLEMTLRKSSGLLAVLQCVTTRPLARLSIEQTAKERLQKIVFGMHRWHDEHRTFPRQANYDTNGKPLLSWRVHLLPYLGDPYAGLCAQFHLNEPWDSEHNLKLIKKMPDIYVTPGSKVAREGRTCFVRPIGSETSCLPDKAISIRDIPDGTSTTIAVIEVDDEHAVPWTKPADLDYDPENPTKALGGHLEGAVFSAFCDGAPYVHRKLIYDPKRIGDLRKVFARADGEPVDFSE